jgi:hypothetical protein
LDVLQKNVSSIAIVNPYANAGGDASAFSTGGSEFNKPSSIDADAAAIRSSYTRAQAERQRKPAYASMQRKREGLPAFVHQDAVTSLIKQEQIVLVSGETGCGKTTQVPQFLLDDPEIGPQCRIVVTQPRRLSAISVAERIAAERGEAIGGTIGYNIRLESEKSRTTQVPLPLPRHLPSHRPRLTFPPPPKQNTCRFCLSRRACSFASCKATPRWKNSAT